MAREFVSDCEGPISKNDNAFELAGRFIPEGERFFSIVSRYDDVLADIIRRPGYQAGDTLRLIVPFLKAHGATEKGIEEFSRENLILMPGAKETLSQVLNMMEAFIISTSYSPYIDALCDITGFPRDRVYCTSLRIDGYFLKEKEVLWLKEKAMEIAQMPMLEIPEGARSVNELPLETQKTLERLDEIFFSLIPSMESGKILEEIKCIGGKEKAKAIEDTLLRTGLSLRDVMYVGDSITDCHALRLVRENGGLAVSFNGNGYAVGDADVAILSGHTRVITLLARAFEGGGRKEALDLIERWDEVIMEDYTLRSFPENFEMEDKITLVLRITDENRPFLAKKSEDFRKKVRGEKVGRLG